MKQPGINISPWILYFPIFLNNTGETRTVVKTIIMDATKTSIPIRW